MDTSFLTTAGWGLIELAGGDSGDFFSAGNLAFLANLTISTILIRIILKGFFKLPGLV